MKNVEFKSNEQAVKEMGRMLAKQHFEGMDIPFNCPKCSQEINLKDGLNVCQKCNAAIDFGRFVE